MYVIAVQLYNIIIIMHGKIDTVGPWLSKLSIIRTVQLTVLLEYFDSKCMF